MLSERWHAVEGDVTAGVVVVIDVVGAQARAHLLGLATSLGVGVGAVQPALPPTSLPPEDHVRLMAAHLREEHWDVRLVVGRCGGAALAAALADGLADDDVRPAVLLLDPYVISPGVLLHELAAALGQYRGAIPAEVVARALDEADRGPDDIASVAQRVKAAYRGLSAPALAEMDVDDDIVDELCDRFDRYVHHLVACAVTGFEATSGSTRTFLSADVSQPPASLRGTVTRCGGPGPELHAHPLVRAAARSAVGSTGGEIARASRAT